MILEGERHIVKGKEIILRSATVEEAERLLQCLKTMTGETRFLMAESDEITYTQEEERQFIEEHNNAKDALLMLAFVDGEHAGNASFTRKEGGRRAAHRAGIGIALLQKYTGFGLGRLMLGRLLDEVKRLGFEQAELTVVGGNKRARHLYESLGFRECGRIPHANKYDDGTYDEDVFMVLQFS